jgi:hypothetical protein
MSGPVQQITDYSLRTMDLSVTSLDELQVSQLRIMESQLLNATANRDVEAWSRALRKIMVWYPRAVPNPITVSAEFYAVLDTHLKARTDAMGMDARINPDAPFIMFRRVPVVVAAAT